MAGNTALWGGQASVARLTHRIQRGCFDGLRLRTLTPAAAAKTSLRLGQVGAIPAGLRRDEGTSAGQ